jgi:hypothetical protein
MTKVEHIYRLDIQITDETGRYVFNVSIDPKHGPRSLSGELLAVKGSGERVPIDAMALLMAVWEEGRRSARDAVEDR